MIRESGKLPTHLLHHLHRFLSMPSDSPSAPSSPPESVSDSLKTLEAASLPSPEPPALSEEEQMALFEAELKENDWGHQPC